MTNMNATVMRVTPSPMMVEHAERTRWAHSLCRSDFQTIHRRTPWPLNEESRGTGRDAGKKRKGLDKSHYLYIAVIAAVILGALVGLLFPEFGKSLKPLGDGFIKLIKMMIAPGHLLHHRAGHRLDRQGGHGRQGRRPGPGLLHGHVHLRAGHRPRGRQPDPPGRGPEARPLRPEQEGRHGQHRRLPAGHHSGRHPGPADPARRASSSASPSRRWARRALRSSRPSATARPSCSASSS